MKDKKRWLMLICSLLLICLTFTFTACDNGKEKFKQLFNDNEIKNNIKEMFGYKGEIEFYSISELENELNKKNKNVTNWAVDGCHMDAKGLTFEDNVIRDAVYLWLKTPKIVSGKRISEDRYDYELINGIAYSNDAEKYIQCVTNHFNDEKEKEEIKNNFIVEQNFIMQKQTAALFYKALKLPTNKIKGLHYKVDNSEILIYADDDISEADVSAKEVLTNAFLNNSNLLKIKFSNTVEKVGASAINNCKNAVVYLEQKIYPRKWQETMPHNEIVLNCNENNLTNKGNKYYIEYGNKYSYSLGHMMVKWRR